MKNYKVVKTLKQKKNREKCKEYYELMEKEGLEDLEFDTYEFNEKDIINHNLIVIKILNDRYDYNLQMIEDLEEDFEDLDEDEVEDLGAHIEENKNIILQKEDLQKDIELSIDYLKEFKFEEDIKKKHIEKYGYYCQGEKNEEY